MIFISNADLLFGQQEVEDTRESIRIDIFLLVFPLLLQFEMQACVFHYVCLHIFLSYMASEEHYVIQDSGLSSLSFV